MNRGARTAAAVLLAVAVLGGCSTPATDPNVEACDALAFYYQEADGDLSAMDRQTTVEQVRLELEAESDTAVDDLIATGIADMERAVDGNDEVWELAVGTMTNGCTDYGWTAD